MNKRMWFGLVVAGAIILALAVAYPTQAQQGINDLWSAVLMHSTLQVQGAVTMDGAASVGTALTAADLKATDDLDVTDAARITGTVTAGDVSVTDDLTVTDDGSINDLTVADFNLNTPQGSLTVTMNGWITPTGSLMQLTAAGAVSIDGGARIADQTTGTIVTFVNVGAQTITISETTGLTSAGNIALGAGDSATLQMVGTTWYQIGASNN